SLDPGTLARLDDALARVGGSLAVGPIAQLLGELGDGVLGERVVRFLVDGAALRVLGELGQAVDIGAVVVDLLADLVDHPQLDWADRLVHAVADAGLRFAVAEGMGAAVTFMTTALASAMLPGLGTVAGSLAGQVLGGLVANVLGGLVER